MINFSAQLKQFPNHSLNSQHTSVFWGQSPMLKALHPDLVKPLPKSFLTGYLKAWLEYHPNWMHQMSTVAIDVYQNAMCLSFHNGPLGWVKDLLGHHLQQRWGNWRQKLKPKSSGLYFAPSSQPEVFSPLLLFAAQKKPVAPPAMIN